MKLAGIMRILCERWGWIFLMIKNGWKLQSNMGRNRGAVKCFIRKCCEKGAYINPKLITQGGQFKTNFHGVDIPFDSCVKATTVLNIANIYKQGGKYSLQVFVKECKIVENTGSAKSFLDDFEACPPLESKRAYHDLLCLALFINNLN